MRIVGVRLALAMYDLVSGACRAWGFGRSSLHGQSRKRRREFSCIEVLILRNSDSLWSVTIGFSSLFRIVDSSMTL